MVVFDCVSAESLFDKLFAENSTHNFSCNSVLPQNPAIFHRIPEVKYKITHVRKILLPLVTSAVNGIPAFLLKELLLNWYRSEHVYLKYPNKDRVQNDPKMESIFSITNLSNCKLIFLIHKREDVSSTLIYCSSPLIYYTLFKPGVQWWFRNHYHRLYLLHTTYHRSKIISYLSNQNVSVVVSAHFSSFLPINAGEPQEPEIDLTLCILHINDLLMSTSISLCIYDATPIIVLNVQDKELSLWSKCICYCEHSFIFFSSN